MKIFLLITSAAVGLSLLVASCVKENGFEDRVKNIAQTEELFDSIATLKEQADGMSQSITKLQSAETILEQYAAKLGQSLDSAKTDIAVNAAKIADLETELETVNSSISAIQASIEAIETRLDKLSHHVDDTIGAVRKWIDGTFATLEKTREVDSLLASRIDLNRIAIDSVYVHYRKEISDSLKSAVSGIQTWVNDKLTGYWTIAQTRAKLDSVARAVEVKDSTALSDSLKIASAELTTAYKAAIKTAIDSLGGVLDTTITGRISRAKADLDSKISGIDTRLAAVEQTIGQLVSRLQSVEVIPEYQDGGVWIPRNGAITLSFEVRPASLLNSIVNKAGSSAFSIQAVETKPVTKAVTYFNLSVSNPKVDSDSVLTLSVAKGDLPDEFFAGTKHFNARLRISDGNTDKSSAYFPLINLPDLSENGTSNCYIVSKSDEYVFKATKGNDISAISGISSVDVLWESFGTATAPSVGDLLKNVSYKDHYICFTASDKKGNAVIAARDADDNILWSWHIWLTDKPENQEYNNSAGTMMDRNLGATSAGKGEIGSLGLLYQWGRKDPFLGADSSRYVFSVNKKKAASTLNTWPSPKFVEDNSSEEDINLKYSITNPTTFIKNVNIPFDWYCTNSSYRNDNLWNVTAGKTIYDPCPPGWRVPEGGDGGIWAKAGFPSYNDVDLTYRGMDFASYTTSSVCWYPAACLLSGDDGTLPNNCSESYYWSYSPCDGKAYLLTFSIITRDENVFPSSSYYRSFGFSVRCVQE